MKLHPWKIWGWATCGIFGGSWLFSWDLGISISLASYVLLVLVGLYFWKEPAPSPLEREDLTQRPAPSPIEASLSVLDLVNYLSKENLGRLARGKTTLVLQRQMLKLLGADAVRDRVIRINPGLIAEFRVPLSTLWEKFPQADFLDRASLTFSPSQAVCSCGAIQGLAWCYRVETDTENFWWILTICDGCLKPMQPSETKIPEHFALVTLEEP